MENNSKKPTLSDLDGMTEEERMEKYTEKNYPSKNIRYGSGAGKISPYPKTDKRSRAYYDMPEKGDRSSK